jgi:hypothetical protein
MIALRHARCIACRVARHPGCNFVHVARCKSSKPRPHSQPGFPSIARSACDIHSMHTIIAEKMQCAQQSRKQLLTLRSNPPTCSGPQRSSSAYGTRLCRLSMPGARRLRPCGSPSSLLLHGHARRQAVRCAGARNTRRRRKAMWRGTFGRIDIIHRSKASYTLCWRRATRGDGEKRCGEGRSGASISYITRTLLSSDG